MRSLIMLVAILLFSDSAWAQAVKPNQLFARKLINIRAPSSSGWYVLHNSEYQVVLGLDGKESNDNYVARMELLKSPTEIRDKNNFLELIRTSVEAGTSPDRFKGDQQFAFDDRRGHLCVTSAGHLEDTKARTGLFSWGSLKFTMYGLYCQHPSSPQVIYAMVFSHSGPKAIPELEVQAQQFFEGIQVATP